MQESLKYLLLSDVLSTMEAQHKAYGIDKHLQIQELWQKLPDDLPLEEYKTYVVPVLATNKQEQKYLYDLFDESLKRIRVFEKTEAKPIEEKTDEVAWWKNVLATLLLGLALFVGYQVYKYLNPVAEHKAKRESIRVERNTERTIYIKPRLDTATISDISFTNGQKVGDTTFAHYYIDPDSHEFHIEAKDTFSTTAFEVCLRLVYAQPPIDTICYDIIVFDSPKEEEKPLFTELEEQELPYPHKIEQLTVDQDQLARAEYYRQNAWWIKALLIFLVGAILWAILKWREKQQRQLIAEIESKDQAPYVWNIELGDEQRFSLNESFMLALRRLRKRREEEIYQLDVGQTVQATIKNAGLVDFQYSQATRPPEYLLLVDRKNRNDHRAALFDQISQTFKDNDVLVEHYYFDGDLRTCYNSKHPWGIGLKDLQHQYHNSRLLIVSDGHRLLNPMNGKLARWTQIFKSWRHTAILSPIPTDKWGRKEQQLRELFQVMPNTIQGLKVILEQFDSLEAKDQETLLVQIDDAANAPITVKGNIIETLQSTFKKEPKLVDWVAACAVYPSLHWDLTLHFGKTLSTEENNLISLENLQELTRLPWFVEGKFPDAVREELLIYLKNSGQENFFRESLHKALDKAQKPDENSVASEEYRMNVVLNEWLFTKDKVKKKELEEEFARYLAAGNDPDFVVFKYLDRESSILDTPIPDSWRQHISGEKLSVWRSEIWPWALAIWAIFSGFTIFYNPKFDLCTEDVVEYKEQTLCLDEPWKQMAHMEFLALDYIFSGRPETADSVILSNEDFISANRTEADTFYKNVAVAFYNRGALLYNDFFESTTVANALTLPDNICSYFNYASALDARSNIVSNTFPRIDPLLCINDTSQVAFFGKILNEITRTAVQRTIINIKNGSLNLSQMSDEEGNFSFFLSPEFVNQEFQVALYKEGETTDTLTTIIQGRNPTYLMSSLPGELPSMNFIEVGNQSWTAQNLNIVLDDSWCYNDDPKYCGQYGRLYTQEAAQKACASMGAGWRLPRIEDWLTLIKVYDDSPSNDVYQALIEGGQSDFNAQMGGYRMPDGSYREIGTMGNYWSANTKGSSAEYIYFQTSSKQLLRGFSNKSHAKSCRCVKDANGTSSDVNSDIQQGPPQQQLEIFTQAGLVGLRDQDGNIIIKPMHSNIELDPNSGLYRVQNSTRGGAQMGYIDGTGAILIPMEYRSLGFLQEDRIRAEKDLYGYLDVRGKVVIDFQYEQASDFEDGVAQVLRRDGKKVLEYGINVNGNCIQDCPDGVKTAANCYATERAALTVAVREKRYEDAINNITAARSCPNLGENSIKVLEEFVLQSLRNHIRDKKDVYDEGITQLANLRNITTSEVLIDLGNEPNQNYTSSQSGCYNSNVEKGDRAFVNQDFLAVLNYYKAAIECVDKPANEEAFTKLLELSDELDRTILYIQSLYQKENAPINDPVDVQQGPPTPNYGSVTDPRDGQTYRTIKIGDQTWLAQNMNIQLDSSWCYDNDPKNCQTYGRLYTWEAAKQTCDGLGDGWHLPSREEWGILANRYGGEGEEAYKALIKGGESGFNALLGGLHHSNGEFYNLTKYGFYWSATEYDTGNAWYFYFHSVDAKVYRNNSSKLNGLSCRCLQD